MRGRAEGGEEAGAAPSAAPGAGHQARVRDDEGVWRGRDGVGEELEGRRALGAGRRLLGGEESSRSRSGFFFFCWLVQEDSRHGRERCFFSKSFPRSSLFKLAIDTIQDTECCLFI